VIFYDGPASDTAAVIRASAEAVGVEPESTFANTLWTFVLDEVTLNANSKAGYGLFTARVQDLQMKHPRARGATVAGMSINGTYSGAVRSPRCYLNPGRGLEIGAADSRWGWTVNDKINALYFYDVHCDANGSGAAFRESGAELRKENCGFYFGPHRGTHVFGVVSEHNFGANIVFEPTGAANTLQGVYTELGCRYAPNGAGSDAISLGYATKQWGIIFVGAAAAQNCRIVDGSIASDHVWLTGTEPTASRRESGVEIYNVALAGGLTANWANYRLVNCALELENITGEQPAGAFTVKGGLQFKSGGGVLNHYSEGTFTPALAGATDAGTGWTYSVQAGSFTRMGRMVFVCGRVALSAKSADATGQIVITDLPFAVKNAHNFQSAASISNVLNMGVNVVEVTGSAQLNGARILLHKRTAAAASTSSVVLSDLAATTSFNFSMVYVAA
jgi:hypothetical protein